MSGHFCVELKVIEGGGYVNIGNIIKKARIKKGLTQEELGKMVGVQKSAIAKYENGRIVNIKRSTLQKISSALNIRPSELIFDGSPLEAADLHARILTDAELMETIKNYYSLSSDKQKIVRELILNLK